MTSASRGRRREWVVRDLFEERGCELVARSAGSLGPADILACDDERFYLVAVRMNRWPPPAVRSKLAALKVPPGTVKLAAKVTRRGVEFLDVLLERYTHPPGARLPVNPPLSFVFGPHTERKLEEMVSGTRERVATGQRGTATEAADTTVSAAANRPPAIEHDCLTREHDPDEWCPDCFVPKKGRK